jgi:hypothetical protein
MYIVIPTNREINLEYIKPLLDSDCKIIVVDDTEDGRVTLRVPNIQILHYSDRKKLLGKLSDCIPHKNGACRDFGLLYAYLHGSENEPVICLDDDCGIDRDYSYKAQNSLGWKAIPMVATTHRFYNPLSLYQFDREIYPRGFPYEERGKPADYSYMQTITGNIVFNLGLWEGVFDVNAIDKLYLDRYTFDTVSLKYNQVAVQKGALLSLCSMNMMMVRELIPSIYQLPMNVPVIPDWTIDRYGDIWGGYICKKLIDIRGDILTVGEPIIFHHKKSNIMKNIIQEHYAHIVNIQFCELIEMACEGIAPGTYLDMYDAFTFNLANLEHRFPPALREYLIPTTKKMKHWVEALRKEI